MNIALLFVLLFLSITFGYSACEKMTDFANSVAYYKSYFAKVFLTRCMKPILGFIIVIEIVTTIMLLYGIFEFSVGKLIFWGYYGVVLSSVVLLLFLLGQRLVKDYEGARGIALYFIICLIGLFLIENSR